MRFFVLFVALSILSSSPSARPQGSTPASPSLERILAAIRTVETGGTRNGGRGVTGDGGRAIGPVQVHRAHWIDSRLPGRYEDCHDPEYARREVVAYWQRWCPEALEQRDAEVLARIHNGGPRGARKASTLPFWRKVQRALDAMPKPVPVVTPRVVGLSGATAQRSGSVIVSGPATHAVSRWAATSSYPRASARPSSAQLFRAWAAPRNISQPGRRSTPRPRTSVAPRKV